MPKGSDMSRRNVLKSSFTLLLGAGLISRGSHAAGQPGGGGRTLVAYLSRSGNTRVIAGFLQREFQAELFEIRTAEPYPEDYEAHVELARQQRDAAATPALAEGVADIAAYETVFLGFPVWGTALPAPLRTFLTTHNLSSKTVVPFVTHGGYGPGSAPDTLAELAPDARILEPFVLEMDQERANLNSVSSWLESVEPDLYAAARGGSRNIPGNVIVVKEATPDRADDLHAAPLRPNQRRRISMTNPMQYAASLSRVAVVSTLLLGAFTLSTMAFGQELEDVQDPTEPLVLESRGSFIVGGESAQQTPAQLSYFTDQLPGTGGHVTVDQMYVEYMVPAAADGVPVVMLHGATLSGKSYDTTPDGRMGWFEYFVRQGHPVYVPDQVSRGRSGFDIATYNEVRAGERPLSALPNYWRFADELAWTQFRFGPSFGTPFADEQFPVEAADQFSAQAIPDLNYGLPTPDPNVAATAELAAQLDGTVLMGHSQTGMLPVSAMLADPTHIEGLILLEPGGCGTEGFTDEQIRTLATVPILAVFGDHLDAATGTVVRWRAAYDDCRALVARVNAAGGDAEMLHPPALGIRGNSHMIMMDRNNLQIADLILAWIDRNTRAGGAASR